MLLTRQQLSAGQRAIGFLVFAPFLAVGPFLLLLALISVVRTEKFIHSSIAADGKVVDLRQEQGKRGMIYAPVFEFTAQDGVTYMQVSGTPTYPPEFKIGNRVKVLYVAGHPETARIDSFGQFFRFATVATIIGGALTTLTVLLLRRAQQQRAMPGPWS